MKYVAKILIPVMAALLLAACGRLMYHVVEPGETLYSIGWIYGYDYRQLAKWNGIEEPYYLTPGQRLRVSPLSPDEAVVPPEPAPQTAAANAPAPVVGPSPAAAAVVDKAVTARVEPVAKAPVYNRSVVWQWPTKEGKVIETFSAKDPARQGLDIAGKTGTPIIAAASGRVVYAGSGLMRYGELIIVKHNETYLSAYAHNEKLYVKENDMVKAGQLIAAMGNSGTQRTKLHFEIRRDGKPVDPLRYLPQR
jgi:lipoprotein NlpD